MLDAPSQVGDREPKSEQLHLFVPPYLDASADYHRPTTRQAVTAEQRRGKPYTMRQIRKAVNELQELELLATRSERVARVRVLDGRAG